jgi:hypothetical protein
MESTATTSQLLHHCSVLFGDHLELSDDFLDYMQLSGLKCAYRRRVKETHPDLAAGRDGSVGECGLEKFLAVRESYETLSSFVAARIDRHRPATAAAPSCRPWQSAAAEWPAEPETGPPPLAGLPRRQLRLGDFLYHLDLASWKEIIDALVWQKASRPRLGELGCRFGWLRRDDIGAIFQARQPGQLFGDTAVRLGILGNSQRDSLLFHQKIRQPKLGQFFIHNGQLSGVDIARCITLMHRHNSLHAPLL